jgi:hypothetical protein
VPKLKLIDRVSRLGTTRVLAGVAGRFWTAVTIAAWIFRLVRWLAGRREHSVRHELKPGDKLVIEHSRDPLGDRPLHDPH